MTERVEVDSAALEETGNVTVDVSIPEIISVQVCYGNGVWPTPYDVGIYLDADERSAIINWPRPCDPIKVICRYGEFVVHLDTATEETIAAAEEVQANFHRDD